MTKEYFDKRYKEYVENCRKSPWKFYEKNIVSKKVFIKNEKNRLRNSR